MRMNVSLQVLTLVAVLCGMCVSGMSARADVWSPYYPYPDWVYIDAWPQGDNIHVKIDVDLPSTCHHLDHWDVPYVIGSNIIIDSGFYMLGTICAPVFIPVIQEFSVGTLSPGTYTLSFRTWGQTIKTMQFIVPSPKVTSIGSARASADKTLIELSSAIVSSVGYGRLNIETHDRFDGLCVAGAGQEITAGCRADVAGMMATYESGERYVDAGRSVVNGSGSVRPVGLVTRSLGGVDCSYVQATGAGQRGVIGGEGLNNIGLLVRIWGRIAQVSSSYPGYVYVDDGHHLADGTDTGLMPNIGVRVVHSASGHLIGDWVEVTGISSCFLTDSGLTARSILVGAGDDLRLLLR